jgi:hypothetical protein
MKLRNIFTLFTAIAMFALVGCEENKTEGGNVTFKLDTIELNVSAEGGAQQVDYTITNPQSGAVVLTSCSESWIKSLSTATYGSITFSVAPNYKQEAREAKIKVEYTAVDLDFEILVKQAASDREFFSFEVVENKPTSLNITVTPADLGTAYVCQAYTKAYIDTFGLNNDMALINNDMSLFSSTAYALGQTLLNYLQNISHTGKAFDVIFEGLTPDTDYVVYSYHINLNSGEAISEVYREVIHTAKPETIEASFDMDFEINGAQIKQTITPSDESLVYYIGYMSVIDFKSYYGNVDMAETFVAKWNSDCAIKQNMGYFPSQILEEYGKKGTQTFEYKDLEAETEYVFYVFALSPETAFVASDIVLETVSTEAAQASGMTIEITVEDIYATTANVYWTASDPNGKFARSVFTLSEYNALGSTDAERFASIAANYSFYVATGETDMNLSKLIPNTTYVAFAYGLDGVTPNTKIFTKEFVTREKVAGTSNIQMTLGQHFNIDEAAEVDPEHWGSFAGWDNYALVPVTISGVQSTDEIYWTLTTAPTDYYNYDDEWIRDITSNEFYHHYKYENCYFQLPYENEYSLIAVAKDKDGNFGQLLKMDIYLYKSDAADISTYVYVEEK